MDMLVLGLAIAFLGAIFVAVLVVEIKQLNRRP
jgi:hypothetical protein